MNDRNVRLITEIGYINEKYIKEAEEKMSTFRIAKIAVGFALVIAIGLFLFMPFAPVTSDLSEYAGSDYYPLIEGIEEYRLSFMQPKHKNNFESLMSSLAMLGGAFGGAMDMAPGDNMLGSAPNMESTNGSYVESTDNQVAGVIESDLFKMTDKYIFRLGYRTEQVELEDNKGVYVQEVLCGVLRVYSIDKENSALVAEYDVPRFENENFKGYAEGEIFLSPDGNTITFIKNYTDDSTNKGKVGIVSLDVSDVKNISKKGSVSIDGNLNTSRMIDGKLLLVTEYFFNRNQMDYSNPSTFVPSIDSGSGAKPIVFEDIIFPDSIGNTRYSVVALMDAENLSILGANALLNFKDDVYVSKNNVYITREHTNKTADESNPDNYTQSNMTDIAVLNYSGARLEKKGIITLRGWAEDQYSFDEKDGYLRVVTSTTDSESNVSGEVASFKNKKNVSLYIFDLSDNTLAYKVEDFAPEGEEATAVRFRGDELYVCTAVVVTFTDPVYFFDLSDYENITYNDTGIIEGYSDHLIDYGEGFALGIGRENWMNNKVDMYEMGNGSVVSVDTFKFGGVYSLDYKAYLVNRQENLFGFGVQHYYDVNNNTTTDMQYRYILLEFDGYEFTVYNFAVRGLRVDTVRAAYIDGYLYITTETDLVVEKIN